MIFRQFASIVGYIQRVILARKCRPTVSELWPKFTFLLEQHIKLSLEVSQLNTEGSLFLKIFHSLLDAYTT